MDFVLVNIADGAGAGVEVALRLAVEPQLEGARFIVTVPANQAPQSETDSTVVAMLRKPVRHSSVRSILARQLKVSDSRSSLEISKEPQNPLAPVE